MRQYDESYLIQAMRPRKGRTRPERSDLASKRKRDSARRKSKRLRTVARRP